MKRTTVVVVFMISICVVALAAEPVHVPRAKTVAMIDGQLGPREWEDATPFPLGELARVYAKQRDGYVFIAIEWLKGDMFTMDLYLTTPDGKVFDLHSSAKIGERQLRDGTWPDEWHWWNNTGWVANWSRVDQWKSPVTFMPQKVREFQISRERFAGDTWKVMFEFMAPAQPNWQSFVFPPTATSTSTSGENWIILRLDDRKVSTPEHSFR